MSQLALLGGTPVCNDPRPEWPLWTEQEKQRLIHTLESRTWAYQVQSDAFGPQTQEFAKLFADLHDVAYAFPVTNGSCALEVALTACGIGPGDEVIVPALTFLATASSVMRVNATPIIVDVKPDTLCLDPEAVRRAISDRTKAVIPVHLGMCLADLDALKDLCERHGLFLIEDCAHVPGAAWRGRGVGGHGAVGCFSCQLTKPLTAGEGGVVVTQDPRLAERCQAIINCGRGIDDLLGWNHRMSELQAAILCAQIERLPRQMDEKNRNVERLISLLREIPGIQVVSTDERVTRRQVYYFTFMYDPEAFSGISKAMLVRALEAEGVPVWYSYTPLYRDSLLTHQGRFRSHPYTSGSIEESQIPCPVAEDASARGINLLHPLFLGEGKWVGRIADALSKVQKHSAELKRAH